MDKIPSQPESYQSVTHIPTVPDTQDIPSFSGFPIETPQWFSLNVCREMESTMCLLRRGIPVSSSPSHSSHSCTSSVSPNEPKTAETGKRTHSSKFAFSSLQTHRFCSQTVTAKLLSVRNNNKK